MVSITVSEPCKLLLASESSYLADATSEVMTRLCRTANSLENLLQLLVFQDKPLLALCLNGDGGFASCVITTGFVHHAHGCCATSMAIWQHRCNR